MEKGNNERYFNFPINLLKGFINNTEECLENIRDYSVYDTMLRLNIENTTCEDIAIRVAKSYYRIDYADSFNGMKLYEQIRENYPKTGLNVSIFNDFYNNSKSEFEKVCLLSFLAIKSILQNKNYCLITNLYWYSRVSGLANKVSNESLISEDLKKYFTRHYITKIKDELQLNWGLKEYSMGVRGFYVSFNLSLKELIENVELKKMSNRRKKLKLDKKKILIEVLRDIK
ncbi:hypothetical protein [uncultured Tenacibaculum sp.]|uniref:hypothetical protein n=1 Tax=uncultured Tenacibaculum sp. TaxID=174713 RepID=UPI002602EB83|nr:hypothetical protein [uncultured Tenacibaculum sp.]